LGSSPHLGTAMETPFSPLSFGKSFMKIRSAVPENGYALSWRTEKNKKIPNVSIVLFIGVYGSKFAKFSTLVEHHGDCLPWKFDGGLQQKILRESPKTWNFCTCTCKSAHCVYLGGQRSRSNIHLVGHCLMVPQPFWAFRNSLPFRSYKLRTVCTDRDFSVFRPPFGYGVGNSILLAIVW